MYNTFFGEKKERLIEKIFGEIPCRVFSVRIWRELWPPLCYLIIQCTYLQILQRGRRIRSERGEKLVANNIDRTKKILCHIFLRNHIPQPKGWITVMWGNVGFYYDAFVCVPQIAFSSPPDSLVQSSHLEVNKNIPPPSYESSLPENSISPHIKARYITSPHKYNPFRIQSKVTQKITLFFPNSDVSQARAFKG